ncbi:hypothetical protein F1880_003341 [Penicillium rolfsii]|nr:hypothetical protein F1880_003341 [Penicillium rolfsii]
MITLLRLPSQQHSLPSIQNKFPDREVLLGLYFHYRSHPALTSDIIKAKMGTVTYRDGIAILQLIVFPVLLVTAIFIWKRTGWKAAGKTWRFVISLSLIRIVGSICTLLTISHPTDSIYVAVAVCELIGIAPLMLVYVGLLRQIDTEQRMHPKFLGAVGLACIVGLILGIVGISITDDNSSTFHANAIVKAAMAVFLVIFAVDIAITGWLYSQLRTKLSIIQKKLFLGIVLSWPFLLVRLVYSAIGDFTNDSRFVVLEGDPTTYLCMNVLEEIIAVSICVGFGLSTVLGRDPERQTQYSGVKPDLIPNEASFITTLLPVFILLPTTLLLFSIPLPSSTSFNPFPPHYASLPPLDSFAFTMSQDYTPDSTLSPSDSSSLRLIFSPTETLASSDSSSSLSNSVVFSALGFESKDEFLPFLRRTLKSWHWDKLGIIECHFTDIPLDWGEFLYEAVDEPFHLRQTWDARSGTLYFKMPTDGHDLVQEWVRLSICEWARKGIISWEEHDSVEMRCGTTVDLPASTSHKSQKQPDVLLRPKNDQLFPTVAFEVGWWESGPALKSDVELLLKGSDGAIRVVIIINWRLRSQRTVVAGTAQVWGLDSNKNPEIKQTEEIFPVPDLPQSRGLAITRGDLFDNLLPPNRDPDENLYLDIDFLRRHACYIFRLMNLAPA